MSDRSLKLKRIVVIGPFPPPVHGFAQATKDVAELLEEAGYKSCRIDLRPVAGEVGIFRAMGLRVRQIFSVWREAKESHGVYVAFSGGIRQSLDLLLISIARLRGSRLFLHHHSFAYLDKPTFLSRLCLRVAGRKAIHFSLCSRMKRLLLDNYPRVCVVEILSNAMLKSVNSSYRMRKTVGTVGYLSALTFEKGITTFLEVAKEISNDSKSPAFLIAGPCRDSNIMDAVKAATALCPNVQYVGPVYGDAKQKFLDSMDVLLFPTTYSNEAEPLVILEAAAAGVPVIAWDRGCIAETFPIGVEGTSVTVPREVSFIQTAGEQLKQWMTFPELMERASERTRIRFEEMANGAIEKLTRAFE